MSRRKTTRRRGPIFTKIGSKVAYPRRGVVDWLIDSTSSATDDGASLRMFYEELLSDLPPMATRDQVAKALGVSKQLLDRLRAADETDRTAA
jgi:hypothetical protein